jgi:hypothetical protein
LEKWKLEWIIFQHKWKWWCYGWLCLKLISRGNTASLHTWNIFYKEPISINTISRNTGGRGLVYLDLIISDVPDTPILTAIQYIDGVGITSRIVLSWSGYSGYGIAGYEISYMLSDINWNILFINSTLSDDIYLYTKL